MGDLNESLIALVLALMVTTTEAPGTGNPSQEAATGWQNFALVASNLSANKVPPRCPRPASGGYFMTVGVRFCEVRPALR